MSIGIQSQTQDIQIQNSVKMFRMPQCKVDNEVKLVGEQLGNQWRLGESLPKTVAVIRALQLGDLLCSIPAFRALRLALPDARIVLIGLPWAKEFVERFNYYLDDLIEFPGHPGLPEIPPKYEHIPTFFANVQKEKFDLAIQMHGRGNIVNPIIALLGAKHSSGFFRQGEYCPDKYRFLPYPEHLPEVMRCLSLTEFLGIAPKGDNIEFPVLEKDKQELQAIDRTGGLKKDMYVCIHPGARVMTRRWLPKRFAIVGDAIASLGLKVVITGSSDEVELAGYISRTMRSKPVNLAGRTSLGALAALIKDSRLLIANDTSVSHIAAALKKPSVIVTTASDPKRWSPFNKTLHKIVSYPVKCRPCNHTVCPFGQPCATNLSVESVIVQARSLMNKPDSYIN